MIERIKAFFFEYFVREICESVFDLLCTILSELETVLEKKFLSIRSVDAITAQASAVRVNYFCSQKVISVEKSSCYSLEKLVGDFRPLLIP